MKFGYQKLPYYQGLDPRKALISRPYVPIYLHGKLQSTRSPYYALLDSGADTVLFPSDLAKEIGIDDVARDGELVPAIGIAGQRADVYYYSLELQLLGDDRKLMTPVGFSEKILIPILGRSFFVHFKSVIFEENKEQLELRF